MQALIRSLRAGGHDRVFRAGMSLWTLVLSRARCHGLRGAQAHVTLTPERGKLRILSSGLHPATSISTPIQLTDELRGLLERLAGLPVE